MYVFVAKASGLLILLKKKRWKKEYRSNKKFRYSIQRQQLHGDELKINNGTSQILQVKRKLNVPVELY